MIKKINKPSYNIIGDVVKLTFTTSPIALLVNEKVFLHTELIDK